jgi:two-component system LytT family sensor kinase
MENLSSEWYNRRPVKILTHVVAWAIVLTLPYLLNGDHNEGHVPDHGGDHGGLGERGQLLMYVNFLTNFLWIGAFYLNAYLLTPKLFSHKKYVAYIGSLILLFGLILAIHAFLFVDVFSIHPFSVKRASGFLLSTFLLAIAISTTFRLVRDRIDADKIAAERQAENLKTELSFLRSQINPHFIFNILNNLVALERMKSEELGPTILKLSALMQYMLYETGEDKVPLSMEIEYLRSYIDLQRQRFGKNMPIFVSLDEPEGAYEIEPMLLIPFVENAFKHGAGMIDQRAIHVDLHVKDGVLYFGVKNKYNADSTEVKDKGSGIGLTNVKRRLNLLYPSGHSLEITPKQGWFSVLLKLNLH